MRERGKLGEMLVTFRKRSGMSQEQLAELAQVTKSVIGFIETGRTKEPDFDNLAALALALSLVGDEYADFMAAGGWPIKDIAVDARKRQVAAERETTIQIAELTKRVQRLEALVERALRRRPPPEGR